MQNAAEQSEAEIWGGDRKYCARNPLPAELDVACMPPQTVSQPAPRTVPAPRSCAGRFHLGIGPYWLRFTYATPALFQKLVTETPGQVASGGQGMLEGTPLWDAIRDLLLLLLRY